MTNHNDLIRRGDALKAVTKTAIAWGVIGEPAILITTKEAIAAIPAVAASQPADPVVKADSCQRVTVKPLVWTDSIDGDSWTDASHLFWCKIFNTGRGFIVTYCSVEIGCYQTSEAAKAAAQAGHEARVFAAIDMQPDPRDAVIARLVEAAEKADGYDQDCGCDSCMGITLAIAAAKGGAA